MKNVFKLLGIVCIACSLLAGKCGKGEDVATYKITVKANPSEAGTVTGAGKYESGASATLEAVANAGYNFVEWNDGNKNNPRVVTVTADAEYVANFAVQSGVKVQFGESNWNAEYINGATNRNAWMISAAQTTSNNYPFAEIYSSSFATGTTTATCSLDLENHTANPGDPYMWYYDEDPVFTLDNEGAASWWANNLSLNVTALDADALTISFVANGTALHISEIFDGTSWDNLTNKAMSMTASNVQLTAAKSMSIHQAKNGKIALK